MDHSRCHCAGTAAPGYLAYKRFYVKGPLSKSVVNLHIQKGNPNITDAFDLEDMCSAIVGSPKSALSMMQLTRNTAKRLETMWDLLSLR